MSDSWTAQWRRFIRTEEELDSYLSLTAAERRGIRLRALPLSLPSRYAGLAAGDKTGALRKMMVPHEDEGVDSPGELSDPLGEEDHSPSNRLVHRYEDRVLVLATGTCFSYCRYCFRRRITAETPGPISAEDTEKICDYLTEHPEVREVLVTGGDPLTMTDEALGSLLDRLRAVRTDLILRIGTRSPVMMPSRITDALLDRLSSVQPLWVVVHINHPEELDREARSSLTRMADRGIPLLNQSVLLKGVNDDPAILADLSHQLLSCRVKPYYLFQGDLARGTGHFRVPLERGREIAEELRRSVSGMAMPRYAVDLPGGGGKVPLAKSYELSREKGGVWFSSLWGDPFFYSDRD